MNKYILLTFLCFFNLASVSCFAQRKERPRRDTMPPKDSIEYYEVEIGVKQKNYLDLLAGNWTLDTMRRQARAVPEVLANVSINFLTDSTYSGSLGCHKIEGAYRLKGASIKFLSLNSSNGTCQPSDQEVALQRLLTQTVSAYSAENDVLLLRDGSSNVVFRAHRKKG